ncbi:MAG: DUF366 family protein [Oligoflexia bacterium]|nr:DUF366 family protein [Oligoflexia bacterium]
MRISTVFSKQERAYTGEELRPHFLLTELGLKGSGIGAFVGACRVRTEHLVDWEDRLAADRIEARWMVHFIGEFFGASGLREGVLLQRLFMSILCDEINARLLGSGAGELCRRDGDDLFFGKGAGQRKLSVSIVTASPVSLLLHAGINIDPEGAPVAAIGLNEIGIVPEEWISAVLARFEEEMRGIDWACAKVRPVL